ncbi:hypothetical protein CB0940_06787 [Cercospora beticola]|uniref:Uncharacterized protein n=1 Tax=Cercospora beticola TaxID=122368 RepID=A0A2G5HAL0_CERBT|nr:hypothetical protein CB0940_06787 [Cercospora beticola]PIA89580.1 hypothetical protein CB0940_06787 [Cercospora beticola]WPB02701.1 hypothetical protein RHO25_007337 [Cercospora beticola]
MPTPPAALMMAQADAISRKIGHMHTGRKKRRFDEKMSLDNDLDRDSDTNDGETDNEDWAELGLETMREATLSARSASTENYRKRSLPHTGRHAARTGTGSLRTHAPKAPTPSNHKDERMRQRPHLGGDGIAISTRSENNSSASRELQQPASNNPSSEGPPVQIVFGSSSVQPTADAAQPTPMDVEVDTMNRVESRFTRSAEIDAEIAAITTSDLPIELSLQWPYIKEPDVSKMSCLSGAPAETVFHYQQEALRVYYSENTFECIFHTPLIKFLRQLPREYLRSLEPGSVRLSSKLSHMGFVHRALQDLNARNAEGLRRDVALVPITVEGEADDVWISWNNVDDYDGIRGGWAAGQGKAAKRRRHPAGTHIEREDDELYT